MKKNIMKKSLAVLVAVCMLLGMFPAASFAASFNDINSSHWAWEYVNDAVDRGLFQGTGSGTFEPETNMSRAMFVVALSNFDGLVDTSTVPPVDSDDADDADDQTADDQTADDADTNDDDAEEPAPAPTTPSSTSFSDVAAGQWYSDAVAWASANSIVAGLTETTFGPNDNITREQMASLIVRYASYAGITLENSRAAESFSDSSSISSYASSAVTQCYRSGLINGMGDGTFAPQATATRAQVTVVISKLAALSRGESIIDDEDADTFTVRFDSNGGSAVESQTVKKGEKATRPTNPTKSGFSFGGWYTDEDLKTSYNFNTAVTSSFTLYAKWNTPGSGGGGGGNGGGTPNYIVTFNYDAAEVSAITFTDGSLSLNASNQITVSSGSKVEFGIETVPGYVVSNVTNANPNTADIYYTSNSVTSNMSIAITTAQKEEPYGVYGDKELRADFVDDTLYLYTPAVDLTGSANTVDVVVKGDWIQAPATITSPTGVTFVSVLDGENTVITVTSPSSTSWGQADIVINDGTNDVYNISFYDSAIWDVKMSGGKGTVTLEDTRTLGGVLSPNVEVLKADGYRATEQGITNTVTVEAETGYHIEGKIDVTPVLGPLSVTTDGQEISGTAASVTYTVIAKFIAAGNVEATVYDGTDTYYYGDLQEAVDAANPGDTVTLQKNVTLEDTLVITDEITLDGNDKTITSTVDEASTVDPHNDAISIQQADDTVIKDLTVKMNVTGSDWKGAYGIQVYESIDVELNNITVSGADAGIMLNAGTATTATAELKGTIDVSGNKFGGIEINGDKPTLTISAQLVNTTETATEPTIWIDQFVYGWVRDDMIIKTTTQDAWGTVISKYNVSDVLVGMQHFTYINEANVKEVAVRPAGDAATAGINNFDYAAEYEAIGVTVSDAVETADDEFTVTVTVDSTIYNGTTIDPDLIGGGETMIGVIFKTPWDAAYAERTAAHLIYGDQVYDIVLGGSGVSADFDHTYGNTLMNYIPITESGTLVADETEYVRTFEYFDATPDTLREVTYTFIVKVQ